MKPNHKIQGVNEKQLNQSICCRISIKNKKRRRTDYLLNFWSDMTESSNSQSSRKTNALKWKNAQISNLFNIKRDVNFHHDSILAFIRSHQQPSLPSVIQHWLKCWITKYEAGSSVRLRSPIKRQEGNETPSSHGRAWTSVFSWGFFWQKFESATLLNTVFNLFFNVFFNVQAKI